ncbi:hypothetical protein SAMN05443529_1402 [Desulfosporosinus hippei DSM 8344]|uniref:Uncharacterized protein n=1 Tax=Desulfosporosinus hippei DSM 8344 TaxID=1121419 RepID=A0A1G8KNT6_9FIRM|nr:hypothetical protein SAMN05443529_1402 [Desulfosporosinus hippei DSM 8344]
MIFSGSLIGLVLLIYLIFFYSDIELTSQIPAVFKDSNIKYEFNNGMTYIHESGQIRFPITDDDTTLYVLNGAGQDLTSYFIDDISKELVIKMNIVDAKTRKTAYFQVVKVPKAKLNAIIQVDKVRVRVNYFNGHALLEYDLTTKQSKTISHVSGGK